MNRLCKLARHVQERSPHGASPSQTRIPVGPSSRLVLSEMSTIVLVLLSSLLAQENIRVPQVPVRVVEDDRLCFYGSAQRC